MKKGEGYLVRVSQQTGSVAGTFELEVQFEAPTPRAPGVQLSRKGASGRLNGVLRPAPVTAGASARGSAAAATSPR